VTGPILRALLSHWRRNWLQLFALLAGLALATALWSGVQAINAEARASYDAAAATLGEGQYDLLSRRDGGTIAQATYIELRRAGWQVSPVIEGRIGGQRIVGVDPLTAPGGIGPIDLQAGEVAGFVGGTGQVFATQATLDELGDLPVEMIVAPDVAPGTALMDIGVAQRLLDRPDSLDRLIVAPTQPIGRPPLADVAPQLVRQAAQGGSDVGRLTDSFHLNLTAFGLLSFAVGIFIVNGAIGLAFEQRRPVVRTLRALGVPLTRLIALMALELALFALVAGGIGVVLGYGIASLLLPDVAATLKGLYGADVAGTLQLRPSWWLSGLAIALGGTAIAATAAFIKLARMPLLAAAQPRAMAMSARRSARLQAVAAIGLLAIAAVLAMVAEGLVAGFALLAALLIGAALALPVILDWVLGATSRRAKGVAAQWFWADTRQQLPGLSLALMALLLAMAANVGVSTMVSSFRLTFVAFLDQRLASELYVTVDDADQAAALLAYVAPRTDAVLPIQSQQVQIAGQAVDVFGAKDHATYRDNWQFLTQDADPWAAVAGGTGVLINEQLARRGGLFVGDTISVAGRDLRIAGTYGDYGNPIGQAIVSLPAYADLFGPEVALQYGLRLDPEDVPALVDGLQTEIGLRPNAMINQTNIKAFSLGVFERTFTVTTALNILTLAVAGFAILMSLLTLATMRLPQLAPVWATGMTRRAIGRLELLRTVILALFTGLLALPLGLALAWALLSIVNVAAFGWKLPMFLFPADYARLSAFALLAALVAAAWPARKLATTPPAALLKVFSNER